MNEVVDENVDIAPEIIAGGQWFNTKPLTLKELRGKVVLIDFWTYTCINCQRTLPYLKSWYEKYHDKGLVIIGVHTPEFEFEKNPKNLEKAIADFGLKYPIVQDNNYDTWNAYSNRYWPAKYFVDKNGKVRFTHFGEGGYDESEQMIQQLLAEAGMPIQNISISNPSYTVSTRSPESYLGYGRIQYLVSPEQIVADKPVTFTAPTSLSLNEFAYTGEWTLKEEQALPSKKAYLIYNFDAQQVFLVMRPQNGASSRVRVYLDEKVVDSQNAGADVQNGIVTVTSDRLYKLIKLPKEGQHILKLEFLDGNIELYAFTFG
jgi:thiol-disulfide isomerase/thioredoxin